MSDIKCMFYLLSVGLGLILLTSSHAHAQSDIAKLDAPKVFINCDAWCHTQFIRQELVYINFMRDRQTAEVFVQITSQSTNNGGEKYILEFYGQDRFTGYTDTIYHITQPNSSESDQRDLMLRSMKKGLLPFIVQTSLRDDLNYSISTASNSIIEEEEDPWKYWTFNLRGNMNISGQEAFQNTWLNGRFSIAKVTDDIKFIARFYHSHETSKFKVDSSETIANVITNSGFNSTFVKSISDHFSLGGFTNIEQSTFANYDLDASLQIAAEYNLYPYAEANKRQFTTLYRIGPQYNNYVDTTIFNEVEELLWRHSIEFNFQRIEKWGDFNFRVTYGNYLHDWELLFAFINPNVELNIARGLRFNFGGSFGWTRNQINIPKADTSLDDLLLQVRQLKSNYRYYLYAGASYRFGSQVSNIVNVRF